MEFLGDFLYEVLGGVLKMEFLDEFSCRGLFTWNSWSNPQITEMNS